MQTGFGRWRAPSGFGLRSVRRVFAIMVVAVACESCGGRPMSAPAMRMEPSEALEPSEARMLLPEWSRAASACSIGLLTPGTCDGAASSAVRELYSELNAAGLADSAS